MFLKEFEGRELFRKHGIPVARGVLVRQNDFEHVIPSFLGRAGPGAEFVMKAQLLSGKRGKSGGIVFVQHDGVVEEVRDFFGTVVRGEKVEEILIQEKVDIALEMYVSITIDRFLRRPILIFSEEGGVDIEELADSHPEKIYRLPLEPGWRGRDCAEAMISFFKEYSLMEEGVRDSLVDVAGKLVDLLYDDEALLVEINPLVLTTGGDVVALDAKAIIDNNALPRHSEFNFGSVRGYSELELKAREHDLAYVELDGDIAVIGNGAGLVMATLDAVDSYGGKPANFCDVGGGASAEAVRAALDIVLRKKGVRALFINVFGGITHCDEVAEGIARAAKELDLKIPLVIRMVGTNEEKAHEILREAGFEVFPSFEKAAAKVAAFT